jgi:hypothetical protein
MELNSLQLTRLALIVGQIHEISTREIAQFEEIFLQKSMTRTSDFQFGWELAEIEAQLIRSAELLNRTLQELDLPTEEFVSHKPMGFDDLEAEIVAWIDTVRLRSDQIGAIYQLLKELSAEAPDEPMDDLTFAEELSCLLGEEESA